MEISPDDEEAALICPQCQDVYDSISPTQKRQGRWKENAQSPENVGLTCQKEECRCDKDVVYCCEQCLADHQEDKDPVKEPDYVTAYRIARGAMKADSLYLLQASAKRDADECGMAADMEEEIHKRRAAKDLKYTPPDKDGKRPSGQYWGEGYRWWS